MVRVAHKLGWHRKTGILNSITWVEEIRLHLQLDFLHHFGYITRYFGIITLPAVCQSIGTVVDGLNVVSFYSLQYRQDLFCYQDMTLQRYATGIWLSGQDWVEWLVSRGEGVGFPVGTGKWVPILTSLFLIMMICFKRLGLTATSSMFHTSAVVNWLWQGWRLRPCVTEFRFR